MPKTERGAKFFDGQIHVEMWTSSVGSFVHRNNSYVAMHAFNFVARMQVECNAE
jgi:hypothetical protein